MFTLDKRIEEMNSKKVMVGNLKELLDRIEELFDSDEFYQTAKNHWVEEKSSLEFLIEEFSLEDKIPNLDKVLKPFLSFVTVPRGMETKLIEKKHFIVEPIELLLQTEEKRLEVIKRDVGYLLSEKLKRLNGDSLDFTLGELKVFKRNEPIN